MNRDFCRAGLRDEVKDKEPVTLNAAVGAFKRKQERSQGKKLPRKDAFDTYLRETEPTEHTKRVKAQKLPDHKGWAEHNKTRFVR